MGLRHRREERRQERQVFDRGGTAARYQMRQKILSIGDDYWIENAEGQRVYRVDGKALRLRHTLDLEDADGAQAVSGPDPRHAHPRHDGYRRAGR